MTHHPVHTKLATCPPLDDAPPTATPQTRPPKTPHTSLTTSYMVRIWERRARDFPAAALPPILPIVLSQNAEPWDLPTSLATLLDIPAHLATSLHPFIPDFTYHHLQLAEMGFDDIPGTSSGICVLRAMKAERLGTLLDPALWDEALILDIPRELFQIALRYTLRADIDRRAFEARLTGIRDPELRTEAMSLAQVYRQEGRQEGLINARQKDIVEALELRFGPLPEALHTTITSLSDLDKLRSLLRTAFQCASLEEFSNEL